jgi:hypothetical protein
VRWGLLYRSDALGDLSDDDVSYLARLGVQVVDFRSDAEREHEPDRLPASPAPRVLRPIFGDALDRTPCATGCSPARRAPTRWPSCSSPATAPS